MIKKGVRKDAFFVAVSLPAATQGDNYMDDDVIDLSHLPREAFMNRLRQLSDISSCPCTECRAICDRYDTIDRCEAYQLWYAQRMAIRERFYDEHKQRRHHRKTKRNPR